MEPIYDVIKKALIERGWGIDENAVENQYGELREFINPDTGARLMYLDAVNFQMFREAGDDEI